MFRRLTKIIPATTILFSMSGARTSLVLETKEVDKSNFKKKVREDQLIKNSISPHPMSACDIVKALLRNDQAVQQADNGEYKYPSIEIWQNKNKWDEMNPILLRSKCACNLDMVVNPRSLSQGHPTSFISKDEFNKVYQDALNDDNRVLESGREDSSDLLINSRKLVIR